MDDTGKRQTDIVQETGIDKGALSRYIKGQYEPKQDIVYKLAKALNVSEMWLWGYDCSRERPEDREPAAEQTTAKVGVAVSIVKRLGSDAEFCEIVKMLCTLDANQLSSVKRIGSDAEFCDVVKILDTLDAKQLSSVKQMLISFLQ